MNDKSKTTPDSQSMCNAYDDGNIPKVDLPGKNSAGNNNQPVEPLPESSRPRKDGPGGD